MVKANINNGNLIFIPFDENLPFIEMTEQQFEDVTNGKLKLVDGVMVDVSEKVNQQIYEKLVVHKIRSKYSIDQELSILRQRDTKVEEFAEYNSYVEQCKADAKLEVFNGRV